MLQTERRHDPYPFTWEVPVAAVLVALIVGVAGVQVGRGFAYWTAGAGWHWPTGRALLTSIPAVLTGHPTAGLQLAPTPAVGAGTVLGWVAATEAALLLSLAGAAVLALRRWGPGRMKGMATPAQAEASLGASRLRQHRHIIRPDLYPSPHHRRNP
jgi:hypothetical protein